MRTVARVLLLGGLLGAAAALSGQEPPRRPEADRVIVRRGPPGLGESFDARVQIITTRRARIGISLDLRPRDDDSLGALIASVTPNGPAARAGLRTGDVISSINRISVARPLAAFARDVSASGIRLIELMADFNPGDTLAVEYRRGQERRNASVIAGEEPVFTMRGPDGASGYAFGGEDRATSEAIRRFTLQLEASPEFGEAREALRGLDSMKVRSPMRPPMRTLPPMYVLGTPLADLELAPMNPELGRYFGTGEGVLVINVPVGSRLGLKPGDVVLAVDGRGLAGPAHLVRILRSYERGESFKLQIVRMKKREVLTGQVGE